ncbi:hypothetical protein FOL46_004841 [Perkinsus olseni]|uniref:EF-hand domain-containing protein n=1 Tax=Perkinsus olseni TaxID=32597 RepID=A0A7J6LWG5_PEROL|nr:hypothetical protein FOL46_004841 [Perkinsus olseni]
MIQGLADAEDAPVAEQTTSERLEQVGVDPRTRESWNELFDLFDIDKSGTLDALELGSLIRSMGEDPFEKITQPMLTELMGQVQDEKEAEFEEEAEQTDARSSHFMSYMNVVDKDQFIRLMALIKSTGTSTASATNITEEAEQLFTNTEHAFEGLRETLLNLAEARGASGGTSGRMRAVDSRFREHCREWNDRGLEKNLVTQKQMTFSGLKGWTLRALGGHEDRQWVHHQRCVVQQCVHELNSQANRLRELRDILSDFKTDLSWFTHSLKSRRVKGSEKAEMIKDEQRRLKEDIDAFKFSKVRIQDATRRLKEEIDDARQERDAWRIAAAAEGKAAAEEATSAENDIHRAEGVHCVCAVIPEISSTTDRIREEGLQTEASIEEVIALDRTLLSDATTDIEEAFPYTKVQRSVLGKTITIDAGIGFGARRCEDTVRGP